jgi:HlyD family secretion protein
MNEDPLARLRIDSQQKRRSSSAPWLIGVAVLVITGGVLFFAVPRASDNVRSGMKSSREAAVEKADRELQARSRPAGSATNASAGTSGSASGAPASGGTSSAARGGGRVEGSVLTVSGYIVAHERIEISPRFMGIVQWIGVRKGDAVTNGQVVVRLDDSEYKARLAESDGQLAVAQVAVDRARADLKRAEELVASQVEMQKLLDDARLALSSAEAGLKQMVGGRRLLETWIDWCTIRSPVTGVVLERMVDANELVTPQAFGSGRGPSTSLLALADLGDLQVEIDLGERDLAKVSLGQACQISPEAYPDRRYQGVVAEIAPEASRQKGTLQVKVQVKNPDRYLTPELSAKVDFLGGK